MFDRASGAFRHKNETPVRLTLAGEEPVDAHVFLVNGERLTDMLNDPRAFIPVRRHDGVVIVAKTQIVSLEETQNEEALEEPPSEPENESEETSSKFDPYAMLRISPDAGLEEIRAAYKARIKAVHPDTIAALGLDEDIAKAALLTSQKVNYAYKKILRDREAADTRAARATA